MGSFGFCRLGPFQIVSSKNSVMPYLMQLFRGSDKRLVVNDSPDEAPLLYYECSVAVLRDRLELLGYTTQTALAYFQQSVNSKLEELDSEPYRSAGLSDDYELLKNLNAEVWVEGLRDARLREFASDWEIGCARDQTGELPDLLRWMMVEPFRGFPGSDLFVAIRLALETLAESERMVYDLTDLAVGGWVDVDGELVEDAIAQAAEEHSAVSATIVLTEGSSDMWILRDALAVLYPHLVGYYSFADFSGARAQGGAAELVRTLKAFVAAGVMNRTLAVFDNDAAAEDALRGLDAVELPARFRVLRLPEVSFLRAYPTIGPVGPQDADVNGSAASIELYLGSDALRAADGQLRPVQWTGYKSSVKKYQGEVVDKVAVQRAFEAKVAEAAGTTISEDDANWTELRQVFRAIFSAFQSVDRNRILRGREDDT